MKINHQEIIDRAVGIQAGRYNARVGGESPTPGVYLPEYFTNQMKRFSEATGIEVFLLEALGSMYFFANLDANEGRFSDPRFGYNPAKLAALEELGFTLP